LGRAFNGHLADHHQFLCAHMFGRIDSIDAPISPDIDEQIEARLARFHVEDDPGHQGLIAEDLGAASTPLVLAQLEC
jgi:hypothetical protein